MVEKGLIISKPNNITKGIRQFHNTENNNFYLVYYTAYYAMGVGDHLLEALLLLYRIYIGLSEHRENSF